MLTRWLFLISFTCSNLLAAQSLYELEANKSQILIKRFSQATNMFCRYDSLAAMDVQKYRLKYGLLYISNEKSLVYNIANKEKFDINFPISEVFKVGDEYLYSNHSENFYITPPKSLPLLELNSQEHSDTLTFYNPVCFNDQFFLCVEKVSLKDIDKIINSTIYKYCFNQHSFQVVHNSEDQIEFSLPKLRFVHLDNGLWVYPDYLAHIFEKKELGIGDIFTTGEFLVVEYAESIERGYREYFKNSKSFRKIDIVAGESTNNTYIISNGKKYYDVIIGARDSSVSIKDGVMQIFSENSSRSYSYYYVF